MENIKVALRVRPLSDSERLSQEENIFDIINNEHITVNRQFIKELLNTKRMNLTTKISYTFDLCYDQDSSNLDVFSQSVLSVSESVIHGINSTVFMYGQTGSGKTYTTLGPIGDSMNTNNPYYYQKSLQNMKQREYDGDLGVLLLAMNHILNSIQANKEKTFAVKCSYFEIYNENVYDLLKNKNSLDEALQLSENHQKKDFVIKGLREVEIQSIEDILDVIYQGEENRHYAETILNHSSSRSHTIFKLYVHSYANDQIAKYRQKNSSSTININNQQLLEFADNHPNTVITESCLNFVDLAGSEKISNHHSLADDFTKDINVNNYQNEEQTTSAMKMVKERIKESQSINKSLFFLTQVISLQSQNKSSNHIPYRNSALTKILKSSLGGNSRTLIILCVTPTSTHFEQSLSTMRFGQNAKKIKNSIEINYRRDLYYNYYDRNSEQFHSNQNLQIDLDKKIKDNAEQKEEIDNLKRIINEIMQEKNEILEKLKKLMKRTIQEQKNELENEIQQKMLPVQLHEEAGLIFHTAETLKNNKIYASIDKDVCNLLYDYEGKIALQISKKLNSQLKQYEFKQKVQEQNFNQIQQHYLQIYNELMDQKEELNNSKWRYTVMEKKYKELREAAEGALKRLDLYENMIGINDISNEEINNIENQLFSALDKLKLEKARRIFKDEINSLKIKLGLKQNSRSSNQKVTKGKQQRGSNIDSTINSEEQLQQLMMQQQQQQQQSMVLQNQQQTDSKSILDNYCNKSIELRNALFNDDQNDEKLMLEHLNQQEFQNSQIRHENLNKQRELLRQIFFKNIDNWDVQQQQIKLSQIENLMLENSPSVSSNLSQQPVSKNNNKYNHMISQSKSPSPLNKMQNRNSNNSFSKQPSLSTNKKVKKTTNNSQQPQQHYDVSPLGRKHLSYSSYACTPEVKRQTKTNSSMVINSSHNGAQSNKKQNTIINDNYNTPNHNAYPQISVLQVNYNQNGSHNNQNVIKSISKISQDQISLMNENTNNSNQINRSASNSSNPNSSTNISSSKNHLKLNINKNNVPSVNKSFHVESQKPSSLNNLGPSNINSNNSFHHGSSSHNTSIVQNNYNQGDKQQQQQQQQQQSIATHRTNDISRASSALNQYANNDKRSNSRNNSFQSNQNNEQITQQNPTSNKNNSSSFILDLAQNLNNINQKILLNKSQETSPGRGKSSTKNSAYNSSNISEINEIKEERELAESNSQLSTKIPSSTSSTNKTQLSNLVNPLKAKMKEFKKNLSNQGSAFTSQGDYESNHSHQSIEDITTKNLLIKPQRITEYPTKK
ncbi:kinesin motor catalytic domain protein (macronuclear) [Tetrahymena thermophila SB210]|uniref:Kinesin motor catalytic domain protein n=1 Tax=Tetrahymena thermophila (strain SB210) TaxID=312017 RepID=I7LWM2_TETTS|nr:kinesin motor catalytic domain protein [Tetrahymena thermophila SB210]EAS02150.2 kinesin motor catalytic domain protein [Tetrahymena thermophila SB210]|eukprot:XP_001022395.2 kinesin motor catalytic domain protein [Tetrahymena thermophila SB210]